MLRHHENEKNYQKTDFFMVRSTTKKGKKKTQTNLDVVICGKITSSNQGNRKISYVRFMIYFMNIIKIIS